MTEQAHRQDKTVGERQARDSAHQFEALVHQLTSLLSHGTAADLEDTFGAVLPLLAECLDVDRAHVCELSQDDGLMRIIRSWPGPGKPGTVIDEAYPWTVRRVLVGEETVISRLDDLPPEASEERARCERSSMSAFLMLPLAVGGLSLGCLTVAKGAEHHWSELQLQRVRVVAHILANALERKRAGEALRTSATWFRHLIENAPDAILLVKRDGSIALINDEAERLFGYAPCELVGQSIDILLPEAFRRAHSAQRARYASAPAPRRMGGAGLDLNARAKDGRELPVEISLTPVEGEDGIIICAVRDVSHRRRVEHELRSAVSERVKAARARLEAQQSQLRNVHRHVTDHFQMLGDLIHLQRERRGGGARSAEDLTDIQHRAGVISTLHDALYRSGSLEAVDLNPYLEEVAQQLIYHHGGDERGVKLDLAIEPLTAVPSVALRCGLIVNELVSNAVRHAFPDGRSGTIRVSLRETGATTWELSVRDDGTGTPQCLALDGFGIQLVEHFAGELGGKATFSASEGVESLVVLNPPLEHGVPTWATPEDHPSSSASSAA